MIVTIGEILVEILATELDQNLRKPGMFEGPFPSGAPAVFADQVARLGFPSAIIGTVGADEFGYLNVERLQADHVDVSAIQISSELPTGTAFCRYRANGDRDFLFNLSHSASSQVSLSSPALKLLNSCAHLHIMGSSLFSFRMIDLIRQSVDTVRKRGGTVSFCPNVSKEMLRVPEMRAALDYMLELSDIVLANRSDLSVLTGRSSWRDAATFLLEGGVPRVVVRRGRDGATYKDAVDEIHTPAYDVQSVDPTGAGDCFSATFVSLWLEQRPIAECLRFASAAGALATRTKGPMEGASSLEEIEGFLAGPVTPVAV